MHGHTRFMTAISMAAAAILLLTGADDKPATPYPGGPEAECAIALAAAGPVNAHGGKFRTILSGRDQGLSDVDCSAAFTSAGLDTLTEVQINALPEAGTWVREDWLTSFSRAYYVDDNHAYIIVSTNCGFMCGSGWRYIMRKTAEGWIVESTRTEYVV